MTDLHKRSLMKAAALSALAAAARGLRQEGRAGTCAGTRVRARRLGPPRPRPSR